MTVRSFAALLAAFLLLGVSCGSATSDEAGTDGSPDGSELALVAAECDATDQLPRNDVEALLTQLLEEHVDFTHDLVEIAAETGLDSDETREALLVLDRNGIDLGSAVALVYDDGTGTAFVNIWRRHIQFFVEYAAGFATGDDEAAAEADANLRQYSKDFGAFFESATEGNLPAEALVPMFDEHVETVEALIRDLLAGQDADMSTHHARDHIDGLAVAMADAFSAQFPCRFPA